MKIGSGWRRCIAADEMIAEQMAAQDADEG